VTTGTQDAADRILRFLAEVEDRVGPSAPALVREFVGVGEPALAVEWIADSLADHQASVSDGELDELVALAQLMDTEFHVEAAIVRGRLRN
jgi:hypothetical protein